MSQTTLLALLLGACAGLAATALSLRTPRLEPSAREADSAGLAEPTPLAPDAVPPPLPIAAGARRAALPLGSRVALSGLVRKVMWEPDRDEPISGAVVRVVLPSTTETDEEIGQCVTDARGAFRLEVELPYARLPAALRLRAEKEGWADAWPVGGLPLAIDSLPHSSVDLVWQMTRVNASDDAVGPRGRTTLVSWGPGDARPVRFCYHSARSETANTEEPEASNLPAGVRVLPGNPR